ncbi:DUF397 domain-containing protein [Streptomyces sp. C11-1]|uniref:DUF397 domain-containing protein n=1 Tax=Streptomyces durocortorensis TaxID=2811104 RepID=A0ABY9VXY8_9ACTN|nr:DUF397 domain-containing protein [Streptomyces durocortorensis]WNF28638.1 DUF397 domain-containing protein [Streptomyces durocortorensis]
MKLSSSDYDLSTATWQKSSYSGGDGGNCVEVATWHKSSYSGGSGGNCLEVGTWRKSTHSGGDGGDCLEVLDGVPDLVPVRDSKVTDGPALLFRTAAWSSFIADLKQG